MASNTDLLQDISRAHREAIAAADAPRVFIGAEELAVTGTAVASSTSTVTEQELAEQAEADRLLLVEEERVREAEARRIADEVAAQVIDVEPVVKPRARKPATTQLPADGV